MSRSRHEAGFTLIELMVVITIISIVAVLAIPSMSHEGYDRRAFTDLASVGELVREARTRAVARGAAELLVMKADPTTNSANFTLFEAVAINTGSTIPIASATCNSPTVWPPAGTPTANWVDELQINNTSSLEVQGDIRMQIVNPGTGVALGGTDTLYMCFTPAGRTWWKLNSSVPPFTGLAGLCAAGQANCPGAVTVNVTRGVFPAVTSSSTLVRTLWIPPSGATRITSQ